MKSPKKQYKENKTNLKKLRERTKNKGICAFVGRAY